MVYCAEFRGAFTTAARRDAVLNDVRARIAARPRFRAEDVAEPRDFADELPGGTHGLTFTLRFRARADQEDLSARLQAFAAGLRAPIPGSALTLHDCPHDEDPPRPCTVTAVRAW